MIWATAVILLVNFFLVLIVVPFLGGALLFTGFRLAKVPTPYARCCTAYVVATAYALVAWALLSFVPGVNQLPPWGWYSARIGVACIVQIAALVWVLRQRGGKALLVQNTAVVLTNVLATVPAILLNGR